MNSMTGYGKFTAIIDGRELTVEMKSVNNRYLEINPRLPKVLSFQDDNVRKIIKSKIQRGAIDVFFNYVNASTCAKTVTVDEGLVAEYVVAAKSMSDKFGIPNDFSVSDAFKIPDAVKAETPADDEETLAKLVEEALSGACINLVDMRRREGEGIKLDFIKLLSNIKCELEKIKARAPKVVTDYREKLAERIREALKDVDLDETRLLNEVACFADKADINEEISRLESHIAQFETEIECNEQVGRKLDFLAQEMNREINTMGSKANDYDLTSGVLKMKNELEKIKEQIRNVE